MKIGFFQEKEGVNSAARLISIIGSFWSMLLASYFAVFGDFSPAEILAFISGTITVFGAVKLVQKQMEKKNDA
jgi:hypothetical protein